MVSVVRLGSRLPWERWEQYLLEHYGVNGRSRVVQRARDFRQHALACEGCGSGRRCPWGDRRWRELRGELQRLGVPDDFRHEQRGGKR